VVAIPARPARVDAAAFAVSWAARATRVVRVRSPVRGFPRPSYIEAAVRAPFPGAK
jgi:hypothetical protein